VSACGVPGFIRPLDVDHIVPRARARLGKVRAATGELVPIDDPRNLQALCTRCNRGKRDASAFDFRPSEDRLVESITVVLNRAAELGYDTKELLMRAATVGSAPTAGEQ